MTMVDIVGQILTTYSTIHWIFIFAMLVWLIATIVLGY